MEALSLNHLHKSYGSFTAVKDLSFSIQPGEIFGLLGPNGAGKSTTINMIAGLVKISSGTASVFGSDVEKDYRSSRRLTGLMHQEVVIDNFFTLEQTLRIHAGYYGYKDDPKWRATLIDRLALGPYLKKKPLQLSGGTKRRLMLAKALIHKPRLLILDEPTAGVDVELRHTVWSFVREINRQGTTVVLTTHYLEEAEQMCGRIAIMARGELVALEKTSELLNRVDDRKLLVRVEPGLAELPADLSALGAVSAEDGKLLTFPLKTFSSVDELLARVKSLHLTIADIEVKKSDLEDVFLALTGTHNE